MVVNRLLGLPTTGIWVNLWYQPSAPTLCMPLETLGRVSVAMSG